ncbi:MAG: hypothetical protein QG670_568 [Thermoproteota archaeon]|nr:hypothetical protein [Thermoproteota archaeon]
MSIIYDINLEFVFLWDIKGWNVRLSFKMSTDNMPSDIGQRVKELRELGFNVSIEVLVSPSNKPGLVFKITREKSKTQTYL